MSEEVEEARKSFAEYLRRKNCHISDDEAVLHAIELAYRDMSPRTINGHGTIDDEDIAALRQSHTASVSDKLRQDAPSSQEQFDAMHEELCENFLAQYNELLSKNNLESHAFGKAQKIVNMTFKYLYCFEDSNKYNAWFEYAHMPIDSIVNEWWKEDGVTSCTLTWSNLNKDEYYFFQALARKWPTANQLDSNGNQLPKRPLDVELIMWNRYSGR